jgi:hypothetical protein
VRIARHYVLEDVDVSTRVPDVCILYACIHACMRVCVQFSCYAIMVWLLLQRSTWPSITIVLQIEHAMPAQRTLNQTSTAATLQASIFDACFHACMCFVFFKFLVRLHTCTQGLAEEFLRIREPLSKSIARAAHHATRAEELAVCPRVFTPSWFARTAYVCLYTYIHTYIRSLFLRVFENGLA